MGLKGASSTSAGHITRSVGLQALLRFLASRGVDVAGIRKGAGLDGVDLGKPDQRLPATATREAWRLAAHATGDEAIAIHVAEARPRDRADALDYAFRASPTLRDALGQVVRYARLVLDRLTLSLVPESEKEGARLVVLSPEMKEQLRRIGVTTPIDVVPLWVDTDQIQPRIFRAYEDDVLLG